MIILYPTRDGYTESREVIYCVYRSTVVEGVRVERIAGIFAFESEAVQLVKNIGDGRIVEILRLPEMR